jgi:hypothetical protein
MLATTGPFVFSLRLPAKSRIPTLPRDEARIALFRLERDDRELFLRDHARPFNFDHDALADLHLLHLDEPSRTRGTEIVSVPFAR